MTLRTRIRLESAVAILTATIAILTVSTPSWIETVGGIEPDAGSGALEWGVTFAFAAVAVVLAVAARSDHRRQQTCSAAAAAADEA